MTETIPTEPGWYFARHLLRQAWEPVELLSSSLDEVLRVRTIGHAGLASTAVFTWGPRITMPEGLGDGE